MRSTVTIACKDFADLGAVVMAVDLCLAQGRALTGITVDDMGNRLCLLFATPEEAAHA